VGKPIALAVAALGAALLAGPAVPNDLYAPSRSITEGETAFTAQFKPVSLTMHAQAPIRFRIPPARLLALEYVNARMACRTSETPDAVTLTLAATRPDGSERVLAQLSAMKNTGTDGTPFFSLSGPLTQYGFPGEEIGVVVPQDCRGSVSWAGKLLIYEGT
jgi:hypothetical protein